MRRIHTKIFMLIAITVGLEGYANEAAYATHAFGSIGQQPSQVVKKTKCDATPRREWLFESRFQSLLRDPYRWMENPDDPELVQWIESQNIATGRYLAGNLYEELLQEFTALLQTSSMRSTLSNEILKVVRQKQIHDLHFRKMAPHVSDDLFSLQTISSNNDQYEVLIKSDSGSDLSRLQLIDLQTGLVLPDMLMVKQPELYWDDNGQSFLYVTGRDGRMGHVNYAIFRHKLGTSQAADKLIFQTTQHDSWIVLIKTEQGFIILQEKGYESSIGWFNDQTGEVTPIASGRGPMMPITIDSGIAYFILYSEAPLGEIVALDLHQGTLETIIPEWNYAIANAVKIGDDIFITYIEDAASKLVRFNLSTQTVTPIDLPLEGWAYPIEYDGFLVLYVTNYCNDFSIYFYDQASDTLKILVEPQPPPFEIESFRTYYQAHNGRQVPIWIVKKADTQLTPQTPMMLYGYGGFAINILPRYDKSSLPWYQRGGVTAYVTLPGGFEYGEDWHKAGMLHNKKNVFIDFARAARHLIDKGYTSRDYLAAHGGSNGGLLVGAVVNLYPNLFRVAVPQVGVMDMTRFQLFTAGKWWISEYGNRNDIHDFYNLLSISPYHNLRRRAYPSTLVMTADFDDRVVPSHSYKYAASLKWHQKADRPVLLHTTRWGSHAGYGIPDEYVKAQARKWTFIMKELGMD